MAKKKGKKKVAKPASRTAPQFNFRARSQSLIESAKREAFRAGVSLNTWLNNVVEEAISA